MQYHFTTRAAMSRPCDFFNGAVPPSLSARDLYMTSAQAPYTNIRSVPWRGGLIFLVGGGNGTRTPSRKRIGR